MSTRLRICTQVDDPTSCPCRELPGAGLNGELPLDTSIWSALSTLQVLDLSNNAVTGFLPPQLQALTDLQVIRVGGNQLSGSIPQTLPNSTNLTTVDISNNQFTGAPEHWSGLPACKSMCRCICVCNGRH